MTSKGEDTSKRGKSNSSESARRAEDVLSSMLEQMDRQVAEDKKLTAAQLDVLQHLLPPTLDVDKMKPLERGQYARALKHEIELAQLRGELLTKASVSEAVSKLIATMNEVLAGLMARGPNALANQAPEQIRGWMKSEFDPAVATLNDALKEFKVEEPTHGKEAAA